MTWTIGQILTERVAQAWVDTAGAYRATGCPLLLALVEFLGIQDSFSTGAGEGLGSP